MSHQFSHSFYGGFVSLLNGNVEKIKEKKCIMETLLTMRTTFLLILFDCNVIKKIPAIEKGMFYSFFPTIICVFIVVVLTKARRKKLKKRKKN